MAQISKITYLIGGSEYASGIDISKYNVYKNGIYRETDYAQLQNVINALDFIILRAGYWGYKSDQPWTDERFEEYYENILLPNPEIIRGAYWYALAQATAQEQTDYFINTCLKDKDFDFIVVDFEESNNIMSNAFAEIHCDMLDILQAEYPNKKIFTYSRYGLYENWLAGTRADNYPYWHAQYPWRVWQPNDDSFVNWWRQVFEVQTYEPDMPSTRVGDDDFGIWQCGGDQTWIGEDFGFYNPNIDVNVTKLPKDLWIEYIGVPERLKEDDPIIIPPVPKPPIVKPPIIKPPNWLCRKLGCNFPELK